MSGQADGVQLPPPAPPLPPPRYGQRAATAIARLAQPFFAGARVEPQRDVQPFRTRPYSELGSISSPTIKKEAVHKTGLEILAIDISPYRTHAVLAGREILKTIRVEESTGTEDFNLRSQIISYASNHDSSREAASAQYRDQLSAVDVKWSHGTLDTTIATAAANGRIVIYDLNRPGLEIARLHEHTRQVFRLAFSPHKPTLLLSGSQDGTIRLWDLRAFGSGEGGRSVKTFGSSKRYSANSEAVRDVKWSPLDGYHFAIGTENGSVQKWDFHRENAPLLRLHAHDRSCTAIDWHPDGRFLATGSADKCVKLWDFGQERRMKPLNTIRTPQAVVNMQWRPEDESSNKGEKAAQVCTSYDSRDPRIHIWDFQRPHVPALEIEKYDLPATSFVWHSRDLLWSAGLTGTFTQNDIKQATRPVDRYGGAIAISAHGKMAIFTSGGSRHGLIANRLKLNQDMVNYPGQNYGSNEISPEEQAVENTIHRRRQRAAELRMNDSFGSSTEPDQKHESLERLKELLLPSFVSPQVTVLGCVQQAFDPDTFAHLAENYELPSNEFLGQRDDSPDNTIQSAFEKNAHVAGETGDGRLSQIWKVLGYIVANELRLRVERSRKAFIGSPKVLAPSVQQGEAEKIVEAKVAPVSTLGAALKGSNSNMSTPLARPRQDLSMLHTTPADNFSLTTNTGSSDSSSLDSPQRALQSAESALVAGITNDDQSTAPVSIPADAPLVSLPIDMLKSPKLGRHQTFSESDTDLEERRNALNSYRAQPRTVLNYDTSHRDARVPAGVAPLDRHDSNESFQMFPQSFDSERPSLALEDSFDEHKSISHMSNGSFSRLLQSTQPRIVLHNVREDDTLANTPELSQAEDLEAEDLPALEKVNTQTTNDLAVQEPLHRPTFSKGPKIHIEEFNSTLREPKTASSKNTWSDFASNTQQTADPVPWSIYALIKPLLHYHLDILSDYQLPAILAIWLYNLFPTEFNRPQITSLLLFYHQRLHNQGLYSAAARLRKCCSLAFPEILEYTAGSEAVKLFCTTCNKTLDSLEGSVSESCTRCRSLLASCCICESATPRTSHTSHRWLWCQSCSHGGHASCLSNWFSLPSSEGSCPVLGCGHDCVRGTRRDEIVAEIEKAKKRNRKSVVKDDWTVGESKAVEGARDIVSDGVMGGGKGGRRVRMNVNNV